MPFRQNALSSTFGIQPTVSQFKIVQNFFERCQSKAQFSCFRQSCKKAGDTRVSPVRKVYHM